MHFLFSTSSSTTILVMALYLNIWAPSAHPWSVEEIYQLTYLLSSFAHRSPVP
jgi:hypothetical protein